MSVPEVHRLKHEFNNSSRYFDPKIPDHDQHHIAFKKLYAEAAIRD